MIRISAYLSPMDHQRIVPRRRIFKAGSIECGGSVIDCTVRNLSKTGAALEVLSPLYIPDRFTLAIRIDQLKRACHVIWRKKNRIGIAFD
jgi:PilZ domain